ncbi:TerL [Salmonella phage 36]|nr:TerL [Salmonella phage 36]AKJ74025.1 TerL [Salmonella phage 36]
MHVYVSDSSNFVGEFVGKFLGIEPEKPVAEREAISPWPNMPQQATQAEKVAENDEK